MPAFYSTIPKADVIKTEIVPGGSKNRYSKRSGKAKEKRNGTIGLMGGVTHPKTHMISGLSLKTSAIYGRIYSVVLCEELIGLIGLYINVISKIPNWNLRINMRDNLREVTNCDFTRFEFLFRTRRRPQETAICLYRTGYIYVGNSAEG